jgi:hypothetical protein
MTPNEKAWGQVLTVQELEVCRKLGIQPGDYAAQRHAIASDPNHSLHKHAAPVIPTKPTPVAPTPHYAPTRPTAATKELSAAEKTAVLEKALAEALQREARTKATKLNQVKTVRLLSPGHYASR